MGFEGWRGKGKILDLKGDHQKIPSNFVVTASAIMC